MPSAHPYFASTVAMVRRFEVLLPLLLSGVLLALPGSLVRGPIYPSALILELVVVLLVAVMMRLAYIQVPRQVRLFVIGATHIVLIVTILAITGFVSPVVLFWLPLLLVSALQHGRSGLVFSYGSLVAVAVADGFIQAFVYGADGGYYLTVFIALVIFGLIGYFVTSLMAGVTSSQEALSRSRTAGAFERDRLRAVVNSMHEGVMTTDPSGVVRLQNAAVLSILDTNQSFVGKNIRNAFHLNDETGQRVQFMRLLKTATNPIARSDLSHRLSTTDTISLSLHITPIRTAYHEGSEPGYLVIFRDITKEKSLDEERDEFISVVSHELRTPIAIAEGSLSNLKFMQSKNAAPEVLSQASDTAYKQVLFLASMINDLGTLSRAERGVTDQQTLFSVDELVRDLYAKYQPTAEAKGLALHLDVAAHLPPIIQSRLYIEEILQNFITNAIKYTQKGTVTLHVTKTAERLEFAVSDTGIGIGVSDQSKIYQKFYRAEDYRTRETSGTGLGLYVVQKLAAKIGTSIVCKSRLNHGSRFSFSVPIPKDPTNGNKASLDEQ